MDKGTLKRKWREWAGDLRKVRSEGTFARNAMFAFSGTAVVTLSQVLLTPLIARIYGPEAYGIYGIFFTICTNLALAADGGLTLAYVLPRDDEKAMDLMRANFLLVGAVVLALLPLMAMRDLLFQQVPSWRGMGLWFYLIPLGTVAQAVPTMLTQWIARQKAFKRSAALGGGTNLALRLFNLGYGWATRGAMHGLILGEVLIRGLSLVPYVRALYPHHRRALLERRSIRTMWRAVIEYRNYPLFIFPGRYIALLGQQAPILMLSGDTAVVGQFTLAAGLLLMPLRLIGYSLGTVFQQKAAETRNERPETLARVTHQFHERLFIIGVLPFLCITFFSDLLFRTILGEPWAMSGTFACWMGPFFFFRFLSEPMSTLLNVLRRERAMFAFHSVLLVARIAALLCGLWLLRSSTGAVLVYSGVSVIAFLYFTGRLLAVVGAPWRKIIARDLLVLAVLGGIMALLRWWIMGDAFPMA
ncbi:MAG: lipopolysaccharide biosynthesis protein [Flavobacteriales bacterium]|nr:lipopolysaccharide biosynthesis protein [Flavobacteriales bacterium]MCB9166102.1 lipopolysaccharide biosynthesis protein [Flavobacteriales bacterium]